MTIEDDAEKAAKAIASARAAARRSAAQITASADQLEFELVRFNGENAAIEFNVDLAHETVWATRQQMADLFGKNSDTISEHIANLYDENELEREATTGNFPVVRLEGGRQVSRQVEHFNLDVILSVGYRVRSPQASKFRKWANGILRGYLVNGYALNEARLRNDPNALSELAGKVRELRSNEANLYHAVRDVFAFATTDYDSKSQEARSFFARIQDKFVYAITDKNTGQILLSRADRSKPNMGLQTIKGERPTKDEATVGKNYLDMDELYGLHILCEQFLLFVESKAIRGHKLTMVQMAQKFDDLLRLQGHSVFGGYDTFIAQRAKDHALKEYAAYQERLKALPKGEALQ